jgi:hypothetical protein
MNIIIPGTNEEPGLDTHKVGAFEVLPGGTAPMHSIKGQVAVITGAAGGIGQALALDMAHRGAAGGEEFIRTKVLPQTQLKRLIKPEEIADAICFMITNAAVSGELWADAGWRPAT